MAATAGKSPEREAAVAEKAAKARVMVARGAPAEVETIDKEGIESLGDQCVLVDVRTAPERAISTIPGAISRAAFETQGGAEAALAAGKVVVPFCTIGVRSGIYAQDLLRQYGDALSVRNGEGIVLWSLDGGMLVQSTSKGGRHGHKAPAKGGEDIRRLHVFGRPWALVRDDVQPVMFGFCGLAGVFWVGWEWMVRGLSHCWAWAGCCHHPGRPSAASKRPLKPALNRPGGELAA